MKFKSTRGGPAVSLRIALEAGLAPDGGLFVPESFPTLSPDDFKVNFDAPLHLAEASLVEVGTQLLTPFFKDDELLSSKLPEICARTFKFDIPLSPVPGRSGDFILELYHGPTSAFKDVGARFLAECISTLAHESPSGKKRTVIVATSGDTGGAVAAAFFEKPGIDVVILFPKGRVSPRQEAQLCAWGGNIKAIEVNGTFDDCQRLVKETLLEGASSDRAYLSANSINLGRILPQMIYYAHAGLKATRGENGIPPDFIIPSGNLGNALACLWAKKIGLPIGRVHLAFNANRGVVEDMDSGNFHPRPTIQTLANAMDVGNPSNLERILSLYPKLDDLKRDLTADSVEDAEISQVIKTSQAQWGQILCPHTATAAQVRTRIKSFKNQRFVLVSTAHPVKFESIVEPLILETLSIPESLAKILKRPTAKKEMDPNLPSLKRILNER